MGLKWWILRGSAVALLALGLALVARGDDAVVLPDLTPASFVGGPGGPLPSPQAPPLQAELAPPPKTPPAQAEVAPPPPVPAPTSPVATVHITVPPAPAAPPSEHIVRIQVTTAPAAATAPPVAAELAPAPAAIQAELRHPGPMRNALGTFGERLALLKRDRLVMPAATRSTAPIVVQVVQAPPKPPVAAEVRASPQSPFPSLGSFFRR